MPQAVPTFFSTSADFRVWLGAHGRTKSELIVGFWKVDSGRSSMSWSESVDEALCFGWIDGVRRSIDEHAYLIRFTPRRKDSIWSAVNVAKVKALIVARRMRSPGLVAFDRRTDRKTAVYSYEQREHPKLSKVETSGFRRVREAWVYFESCPPSYKKSMMYWVVSAKRPETRERRLAQLIEACAMNMRLLK